jgi:hypothetical protein
MALLQPVLSHHFGDPAAANTADLSECPTLTLLVRSFRHFPQARKSNSPAKQCQKKKTETNCTFLTVNTADLAPAHGKDGLGLHHYHAARAVRWHAAKAEAVRALRHCQDVGCFKNLWMECMVRSSWTETDSYRQVCDVDRVAALVANDMRHWLHVGLVIFYVAMLATYTGVAHGTNYTHYTRYVISSKFLPP